MVASGTSARLLHGWQLAEGLDAETSYHTLAGSLAAFIIGRLPATQRRLYPLGWRRM